MLRTTMSLLSTIYITQPCSEYDAVQGSIKNRRQNFSLQLFEEREAAARENEILGEIGVKKAVQAKKGNSASPSHPHSGYVDQARFFCCVLSRLDYSAPSWCKGIRVGRNGDERRMVLSRFSLRAFAKSLSRRK